MPTTDKTISEAIVALTETLEKTPGDLRICCKKDYNKDEQMRDCIRNWADSQAYCILGNYATHKEIKALKARLEGVITRDNYTEYQMNKMRITQKCVLEAICKMARSQLLSSFTDGLVAAADA